MQDSPFARRRPEQNILAPHRGRSRWPQQSLTGGKGTEPVPTARLVTGVAVAAALISGTVLLTGCQPPPDDPKVILVAASATANEPAPLLSDTDRAMLRTAGSTSTRAAAFVVDPNSGQAREVSLTPRRPDARSPTGRTGTAN